MRGVSLVDPGMGLGGSSHVRLLVSGKGFGILPNSPLKTGTQNHLSAPAQMQCACAEQHRCLLRQNLFPIVRNFVFECPQLDALAKLCTFHFALGCSGCLTIWCEPVAFLVSPNQTVQDNALAPPLTMHAEHQCTQEGWSPGVPRSAAPGQLHPAHPV